MKSYDLILLYTIGRVHNHYLSVVRHLGGRLRIGIYVAETQKKIKTAQTEQLFLELCRQFGGEILGPGSYACGLLAIPQFRYQGAFLQQLPSTIRSARRIILQTFGYGTEFLEPLVAARVDRLYVYDRRVFENKLKTSEQRRLVEDHFELVEMGTPFAKYPVFEEVSADYMMAFPTDLSFADTRAKAVFARNVNRLLGRIPAESSVLLKLHNVSDGGRLIERHSRAFRLGVRAGRLGLAVPPVSLPGRLGEGMGRAAFGAEYVRLTRRTRAFDGCTPYFNFGLELFLPSVRRGLITGRSSVVWYALVNRLPVYNCDDETERVRAGEGVTDSYRAFGVPPCHGRLEFDARAFDRIAESVREADLLELLQKEL